MLESNADAEGELPKAKSQSVDEKATEQNHIVNIPQTNEKANIIEQAVTQQSQTTKSKLQTDPMEVHHHTHPGHHKKKWTDYFWEFLMLFLAVFCGFLAEYKLEQTIERHREEEFIISMIEDAKTDTANIRKAIDAQRRTQTFADSLADICFAYDGSQKHDFLIYKLYRNLLSYSPPVNPTQRTLPQLKNSGGMRLIRNKKAADAILLYDIMGQEIIMGQTYLDEGAKATHTFAYDLLNLKYYNPGKYSGVSDSATLLTKDKQKLIAFGNRITTGGANLDVYRHLLKQLNTQAITLINTLKKEYDLEDA